MIEMNTKVQTAEVAESSKDTAIHYVGTLVGESTSREFRLAVARESIREQDIIAVDAQLRRTGTDEVAPESIRIWAKVQRIERLNPLFPAESAHELAETQTSPFATVLSLSREMVTAVCQVLGTEPLDSDAAGKLGHLRYPAQPASSAYRPASEHIRRVVLGDLPKKRHRALDIATLANRGEVDVSVDGHVVVTRHLAILAMTGAGKSWTSRRIIEQLAEKNYPIVIFDPRGDYTGLADIPSLKSKVTRYFAQFPIFDEDAETVADIVSNLAYQLSDTMRTRFVDVFRAATSFYVDDVDEMQTKLTWISGRVTDPDRLKYGLRPDLWLVATLTEAAELAVRNDNQADKRQIEDWGWQGLTQYARTESRTLDAIKKRCRRAASVLLRMEQTNRKVANSATPLPTDRKELVRPGAISVVSLAGYTGDFQATIYSLIAEELFSARVSGELAVPGVLLVLEEAHNFAPARANTPAEESAVRATRQIAQEGRKFGVGLLIISQRPSRLDETTLSMCNSYVIMRMVNPADQNFVRKVIETIGEDEAKLLPDLDVGEALLSGQFINFPVLARIKAPSSKGEHEEEDAFDTLNKYVSGLRKAR
jgi:hypothetical protein